MILFDLEAIERRLQPYVAVAASLQGEGITTGRTLQLAEHVGSPHQRLPVVHVAGTSGKTSTSYYVASLLLAGGSKVGLTVSPHIDSIADRVQVGGSPLSGSSFVDYMTEFLALVETAPVVPTYFELMMVFALWVFDKQRVDYAVVETGLGGLHDSSNICVRPDKVAVITDIGIDHTHILGNTLSEIAEQKLGTVHQGNVIITHRQSAEVMAVIDRTAAAQSSEVILASHQDIDESIARFQKRNWSLAKAVYDYLAERDELPGLSSQQLVSTQTIDVPGRMDIYRLGDKTVVIDGAHNQQKLAALVDSFREAYPDTKPIVVLAVKQGKDIEQMAPILAELASQVMVTSIEVAQDMPHQSIPGDETTDVLSRHGVRLATRQASNQSVLGYALGQPEAVVLVVGSLYLASTMRQLVRSRMDSSSWVDQENLLS